MGKTFKECDKAKQAKVSRKQTGRRNKRTRREFFTQKVEDR